MSPSSSCIFCYEEGVIECSNVPGLKFCSRDHQRLHCRSDGTCNPYAVSEDEQVGRYLVASRDIQAGEVVWYDTPLEAGPNQLTTPVCLGCYASVSCDFKCSNCLYPMCSPDCSRQERHLDICKILSKCSNKDKLQFIPNGRF